MNSTPTFVTFLVGALVAGAVTVISCSDDPAVLHASNSEAKAGASQTAEHLVARSSARWELIVAAQDDNTKWVDVYDYELPEFRRRETLALFMENKEKFHYDAPTTPRVLLIDGDDAYVQVDCTWLAYKHPIVAQQNPGHTELMEMLEVWRWREGDWYMEGTPRERSEFLRENPEIAAKVDAYLATH